MKDMDVRVRAMLEESEIPASGADELVELLVGLEERYVDAVPEPSPELGVLLGVDDASPATRLLLTPRRRRALAAGVVALGAVVTTGLAAAANELPEPAQRWVSELSDRYLPFDLPHPTDRAAHGDGPWRLDGDAADERSREEGGAGRRRDGVGTTGRPDGAAQYQPAGSDHRQAGEAHDDGEAWEGQEDEPEGRRSGHPGSEPEDAHVGSGPGEYETEDGEEDGEDTAPVTVSPVEPDESDSSEESEESEEPDHEEAEEAEGSGDD